MIEFTAADLDQLTQKKISEEQVVGQIKIFKEGIPFVQLEKAAVISDGILKLTEEQEQQFLIEFDLEKNKNTLLKFTPASGAASRMFKALFNFIENFDPEIETLEAYLTRTKDTAISSFFEGLEQFPFYSLIQENNLEKATSKDQECKMLVEKMLLEKGFNYGIYPKGLLPFHDYKTHVATAFEEHLKEAAAYTAVNGHADLHFTISIQHQEKFNTTLKEIISRVSKTTHTSFEVRYSFQKAATDTVAVTLDNELFRNKDGSLLFRPGGHGALIENLNEVDADIVFIKNIDNVVVSKYLPDVANSKKILAGLLLSIQKRVFDYAAILEDESMTIEQIYEAKTYLETALNVRFSDTFQSFNIERQLRILKDKINRPIRVCGMVKNEGEPGGGPFWIKDQHNNITLQIVESAQIDTTIENQEKILKNATHFNPVDLVCGLKNHKGEKYNLLNFVDPKQGFITEKTKEGKKLKALELPGLWNGAMAYWNTIFVEVPIVTFNPVKTVNDLLKPTHQAT